MTWLPRTGLGQARNGYQVDGPGMDGTCHGTDRSGYPRSGREGTGQARKGSDRMGFPRSAEERMGSTRSVMERIGFPGSVRDRMGAERIGRDGKVGATQGDSANGPQRVWPQTLSMSVGAVRVPVPRLTRLAADEALRLHGRGVFPLVWVGRSQIYP